MEDGKLKQILISLSALSIAVISAFVLVFGFAAASSGYPRAGEETFWYDTLRSVIVILFILNIILQIMGQRWLWLAERKVKSIWMYSTLFAPLIFVAVLNVLGFLAGGIYLASQMVMK